MINSIKIYISRCTDPYINLATEKLLMDSVSDDEAILYLWQNKNTVVIGKNQNPWAECKLSEFEKDGILLARRLSGGGAVFHDLGNLNFTFISATQNYDLEKNMKIIALGCKKAGIETQLSGRNDILAEGRKFSGNAFYNSKGKSYHHGTIMINADIKKLGHYLTPSAAKLEAKGVKSVKSRVINLTEINPALTTEQMINHLTQAFEEVYGMKAAVKADENQEEVIELSQQYKSWDYLYGSQPPFTFSCDRRFDWGSIDIRLNVEKGKITSAVCYTDSMDWELAEKIKNSLEACRFEKEDIQNALKEKIHKAFAEDIAELICENI